MIGGQELQKISRLVYHSMTSLPRASKNVVKRFGVLEVVGILPETVSLRRRLIYMADWPRHSFAATVTSEPLAVCSCGHLIR